MHEQNVNFLEESFKKYYFEHFDLIKSQTIHPNESLVIKNLTLEWFVIYQ